jgi:hypothetical protein
MRSVEDDRLANRVEAGPVSARGSVSRSNSDSLRLAILFALCVLGLLWLRANQSGLIDWWGSRHAHAIPWTSLPSTLSDVDRNSGASDAIVPNSALALVRRPVQLTSRP